MSIYIKWGKGWVGGDFWLEFNSGLGGWGNRKEDL